MAAKRGGRGLRLAGLVRKGARAGGWEGSPTTGLREGCRGAGRAGHRARLRRARYACLLHGGTTGEGRGRGGLTSGTGGRWRGQRAGLGECSRAGRVLARSRRRNWATVRDRSVWGRHTVVAWLSGVWAQLNRRLRARNRPCAAVWSWARMQAAAAASMRASDCAQGRAMRGWACGLGYGRGWAALRARAGNWAGARRAARL
jgi:hypothetical protein